MSRLVAPKLMGFGDAIQANQSMTDSFNKLGNISQNYLNYDLQNKQNEWNKDYEKQKLDFENTKYNNELQDKENTKIANRATFQTLYPEEYKSFGAAFGGVPSVENANKMNSALGSVDLNNFDKNRTFNYNANKDQKDYEYQQNRDKIEDNFKNKELSIRRINALKPDYATFNGVDANGNPTLSMIDKNTGKVVNTGQQVYQEPKQLAPEQSLYYLDRANEMKQKQLLELEKIFRESNEFSNLEKEDQMKAIDYLRTNGKLPQISYDNSWLGKDYYLPMSEAVKQESKKVPKKDGSDIDLYKD